MQNQNQNSKNNAENPPQNESQNLEHRKKAFIEELYKEYANDILIYLYRCTKDYHLASDLLQDTFLNFLKIFSKQELPTKQKAKIYLFRTAKNIFINNYRKLIKNKVISFQESMLQEEMLVHKKPDEIQMENEEQKEYERIIQILLDHLTPQERTMIILRYNLEMNLEEIAKIMGKSISTISRNIDKIQKKLLKIAKEKQLI